MGKVVYLAFNKVSLIDNNITEMFLTRRQDSTKKTPFWPEFLYNESELAVLAVYSLLKEATKVLVLNIAKDDIFF